MKALISPLENTEYISGWNAPVAPSKNYTPIFTVCGERICQVQVDEFPVAEPYFWIDCDSSVSPATNCYDAGTKSIILIPPNVPDPTPQPVTTGTQTA